MDRLAILVLLAAALYARPAQCQGCVSDEVCQSNQYCAIDCPADNYPAHTALLTSEVKLESNSFVAIPPNRMANFSTDITFFARLRQAPNTVGYLLFYGTETNTNFAIELDSATSSTTTFLNFHYYSTAVGETAAVRVPIVDLADGADHCFAIVFDPDEGLKIFVDGSLRLPPFQQLTDPDFYFGIDSENPGHLILGGTIDGSNFFEGTIYQVVIFNSLLAGDLLNVSSTPNEFSNSSYMDVCTLVSTTRRGACLPYRELTQSCEEQAMPNSLLCTATEPRCNPSLRCLPEINGDYRCQNLFPICTSDDDCPETELFCGRERPAAGQVFLADEKLDIEGTRVDYINTETAFDGFNIITLPSTDHPDLSKDFTIFAMLRQVANNNGFVTAKGANRAMRDFGLYVGGSTNRILVFYRCTDGQTRCAIFENHSIDDGALHTIAAVVDSDLERAVLYIDGEVVNSTKLECMPAFQPGLNTLYIGGTPEATETGRDRFEGTINFLAIFNSVVTYPDIAKLSNSVMDPVNTRHCRRYQEDGDQCFLGDISDYRCTPPALCVYSVDPTIPVRFPNQGESFSSADIMGRCFAPCDCDGVQSPNFVCGSDGRTYENSCFAECVGVQVVDPNGPCTLSYEELFNMTMRR